MDTNPLLVRRPLPSTGDLLPAVGLVALTVGATLIAVFNAGKLIEEGWLIGAPIMVLLASTVLLSVMLVRREIRHSDRLVQQVVLDAKHRVPGLLERVLKVGALGGSVYGAFCGVLTLIVFSSPGYGDGFPWFFPFIVAVLLSGLGGGIFGLPCGLLYALCFLLPIHRLVVCGNRWDERDRYRTMLGAWMIVLAGLCTAAIGLALWDASCRPCWDTSLVLGLLGLQATFGTVLALRAAFRRWRRWRWLDRVRCGEECSWRVVPAGVFDEATLAPLREVGPAPHDAVLVHRAQVGGGAVYREPPFVPVARVRAAP